MFAVTTLPTQIKRWFRNEYFTRWNYEVKLLNEASPEHRNAWLEVRYDNMRADPYRSDYVYDTEAEAQEAAQKVIDLVCAEVRRDQEEREFRRSHTKVIKCP